MCTVSCFTVRSVKYGKEQACDHLLVVLAVGLGWSAPLASLVVEEDAWCCPSAALCLWAAGVGVRLFLQGVCRVHTNEAPKATLSLVGVDQRSRPKVSSSRWFMREGLLCEWAVLTVPPWVITSGFGAKVHEGMQGGSVAPLPPPPVRRRGSCCSWLGHRAFRSQRDAVVPRCPQQDMAAVPPTVFPGCKEGVRG